MGMFDYFYAPIEFVEDIGKPLYLECLLRKRQARPEVPVPNVYLSSFQTKNLACDLNTYWVDSDRQLWERSFYAGEHKVRKCDEIKDTVYFYTYLEATKGNDWAEFIATIDNGKLLSIKVGSATMCEKFGFTDKYWGREEDD